MTRNLQQPVCNNLRAKVPYVRIIAPNYSVSSNNVDNTLSGIYILIVKNGCVCEFKTNHIVQLFVLRNIIFGSPRDVRVT